MKRIISNLSRLAKSGKVSNGLLVKVAEGKVQVKGKSDKSYLPLTMTSKGAVMVNGYEFKVNLKATKPFKSFRAGLIKAGLKGIQAQAESIVLDD